MNIFLTGGTGFIGTPLVHALQRAGHRCVVATRTPRNAAAGVDYLAIDWRHPTPAALAQLQQQLATCDAVINLAGASVGDGRWTAARKTELRESRLTVTKRLVTTLAQCNPRPRIFLSASGTGYYGDQGAAMLTESAPAGDGFLATMARDWERAAQAVVDSGVRVICLRIGLVLAREARALRQLVPLFRWGLGGPVGSGRQWMSWIHRDDLIALVLFLLGEKNISGPVNASAPHPVTNAEFSRTLAQLLHRPALCTVPAILLRLLLGERASLLLDSQRATPAVLQSTDFQFRYSFLKDALAACGT